MTEHTLRLRKRKMICYNENLDSNSFAESEKDDEKFVDLSNSSDSAWLDAYKESSEEEEIELTEYELARRKNIEERQRLFRELKITEAKEKLQAVTVAKVDKKKTVPKKTHNKVPLPPRPKSLRLQKKSPVGVPLPEPVVTVKSSVDNAVIRKSSEPIPMNSSDDNINDDGILDDILDILKTEERKEKELSPQVECTGELEKFQKELSRLKLPAEKIAKVVPYRIYSMAVHPTESKLLLAAGDKWGYLGLWDVGTSRIQKFQPHVGPVNCTSFCAYNPTKIYSTSHDGTVRCGDMNKLMFEEFYASDEKMSKNHTTWHCQVEENCLMVCHGNGKVALLDSRSAKRLQGWYSCHERSVRTVQLHPLQDQYFITSSAVCEAKIWDRRYLNNTSPDAVSNLVHPKGLTSAFFSPAGKHVLTTCNDDRVRVYSVSDMVTTRPNVIAGIKHNTHTGQWLTTFKATWHPRRDDVFIVGSMGHPRKMAVFDYQGKHLHDFMDENLTSICSVCLFHPTQNIVFGGNSSGRVHVFM